MKKFIRVFAIVLTLCALIACVSMPALAAEGNEAAEAAETVAAATDSTAVKAIVAAAIIIAGAGIGAVCMAIAIKKSVDSTARQPEAAGDIRSSMMLGLVFIETAIIYALIVAILVIFVM
ncbi:MAG: ATP synthase F0 subunit C [Clostridia bacterium]|nr:ATP synthase F0 subunit C [Clostridia bacterium]